jgi:uncharacterized lipoprotein YajG
MKKIMSMIIAAVALSMIAGCSSDSEVASYNVSQDAHQFKVFRRVVFYNGITDTYILSIEGYCSVTTEDGRLAVIIKTDNGTYLKHYLGLSDNVTYFCEQIAPSNVNASTYRVLFKPLSIVPDVRVVK